jgi:hypothetical protein
MYTHEKKSVENGLKTGSEREQNGAKVLTKVLSANPTLG